MFSQPYLPHPNNRWTRLNDRQVHALYENDHVRSEVYLLKEAYLTHAQALLHNDLHSGSILVTQTETKVIDPEFAFYGPIGHDVGSFLAHLVLSYVSQRYHTPDPEERADYRSWLLETLRQTWERPLRPNSSASGKRRAMGNGLRRCSGASTSAGCCKIARALAQRRFCAALSAWRTWPISIPSPTSRCVPSPKAMRSTSPWPGYSAETAWRPLTS